MNRKRDLEDLGLLYENTFVEEGAVAPSQNNPNRGYAKPKPGTVQRYQAIEDENPLINDQDDETLEGKIGVYTNKPSLKDLKSGTSPGVEKMQGKIVQDMGKTVLIDMGMGFIEISKDDLEDVLRADDSHDEEDYEDPESGKAGSTYDAGPNQQDMGWSSEAEKGGEQTPSAEVTGLYNKTPEGPSSQRGGEIDTSGDNPNEEEEADKAPLPYGKIDVNRMPEPDLVPIAKVKVGNVVYKLEGPTSDQDEEDDNAFPEDKSYDGNEDEEMSLEDAIKVINKHLKARVHGDESHAGEEVRKAKKAYIKNFVKKRKEEGDKEETGRIPIGVDSFKIKNDEDELGQAMAYKKITGNEVKKDEDEQGGKAIPKDLTYFDSDETDDDDPGKPGIRLFNPKTGHTKKESFNSHGDRDMSLLAEKYLNINNHE